MYQTQQEEVWKTAFGEEYSRRNNFDNSRLDEIYVQDISISRTAMNEKFIGDLDCESRILEVGCNIGMHLRNFQEMGFRNLYGIELQPRAVELSKNVTRDINIIQGNAYDIPFKDGFFDLVFSNRVLIHLNPDEISKALKEIVRCSNTYVYGSEYYSDVLTEIKNYHGYNNIAWKRDFAKLYSDLFPELKLLKEEKYKYTFNNDIDSTFLFKKEIRN